MPVFVLPFKTDNFIYKMLYISNIELEIINIRLQESVMSDRTKIGIGFGVTGIAILGLVMFALGGGAMDLTEMVFILLTLVLVAGVTYIMISKSKAVKKGLPAEDELSKKVSWKAGAYAYYATIWIAIAIMWYNTLGVDKFGVPELDTIQIIGLIVLLSGVIYIGLALLFNKKGNI